MADYPVFNIKSTKEKPKTFIQLKLLKNNNEPSIEFNCNTDFDVKINDINY